MAGPAPSSPVIGPVHASADGIPPPPLPTSDWRERLADLRRRTPFDGRWAVWALVAMAVIGVGLWLLRPSPTPVEEALPVASTAVPVTSTPTEGRGAPGGSLPASGSSAVPDEVVAHAAGAVGRPGVYRLDATARVDDLVRLAGGLAPDADPSRLNLAAPLADGTRVYVPRLGEDVPAAIGPDGPPPDPVAPPGGLDDGGGGLGGLVDINTADEAELDELPGVGPATAAAIVTFREENGGFLAVDDLLDVRGIGEAKLEQLRPLVTVG